MKKIFKYTINICLILSLSGVGQILVRTQIMEDNTKGVNDGTDDGKNDDTNDSGMKALPLRNRFLLIRMELR